MAFSILSWDNTPHSTAAAAISASIFAAASPGFTSIVRVTIVDTNRKLTRPAANTRASRGSRSRSVVAIIN